MKLRAYTPDDYINGVPCVYSHGDKQETVKILSMGGEHPFDGSREMCFKFYSGYIAYRRIGGSELSICLWVIDCK